MKSIRHLPAPLFGAMLGILMCGTGHASLVCSTPGVCYSVASLPAATTDITNYALTLDKFDSSYGTLTGVTLYFQATETVSSFQIHNGSASSASFNALIQSYVNLGASNSANPSDAYGMMGAVLFATYGGYCGPSVKPGACATLTIAGNSNGPQYGPFSVHLTDAVNGFTSGTGTGGTLGVVQSGTSIANYVASGGSTTFDLGGSTQISTTFLGGGGNLTVNQSTQAAFVAEVDYAYAAASVPEPATMGLIGGALIGLAAIRKRLKK